MRTLDFWRGGPERGAKRRERSIAPARNELLLPGGWQWSGEAAGPRCTPSARLEPAINSLFLASGFSGGPLLRSRREGRSQHFRESHVCGNSSAKPQKGVVGFESALQTGKTSRGSVIVPWDVMMLELGLAWGKEGTTCRQKMSIYRCGN